MAKIPSHFTKFLEEYPEVGDAYQGLGKAIGTAGPLDKKTQCLIKLGIAVAAGQEGGSHSAARKAAEAGCSPEEMRHAVLLTLTSIGFPAMMRGLSWVEDVLDGPNQR